MYKDVGNELKRLAKLAILGFIGLFALIGTLLGFLAGEPQFILAYIVIGAFIGLIIGHFSAIHLYAWGELVDSVTEIKKMLKEKEGTEET